MVAVPEKSTVEIGETGRIIDAFKQQVLQSLEKERSKLKETAEQDAKQILARAYQESSGLTQKAQEQGTQIIQTATAQAKAEVENILAGARSQAEQIVRNADEIARRDAKEKTRKEVEKTYSTAKEEASKQASAALQSARDEAGRIIAEAKKEATKISRQVMDEAEEELKQIMATAREEARIKAEKEASEIVANAKADAQKEKELMLINAANEARDVAQGETNRILSRAKLEAESVVNSAKTKVRQQLEESSRLMIEMQQKMQQVLSSSGFETKKIESQPPSIEPVAFPPIPPMTAHNAPPREEVVEKAPPSEPPRKVEKPTSSSDIAQAKIDSIFTNDENRNYQGRLKIDVAPPVDAEQISLLAQNLTKNSNLRVLGNGGAEDGSAWIEVDVLKPVPLVSILRKIPGVKDVVGAKSYIIIALKAKQLV
jgi:F0F1-type ATP synthase membrane subunit b/b'